MASPPNTRPPPVATSENTPARCSYFHSVFPVSTEMAHTAPTLSVPGAMMVGKSRPYTFDGSRLSVFVVKLPHRFCIGMYITLVRGL